MVAVIQKKKKLMVAVFNKKFQCLYLNTRKLNLQDLQNSRSNIETQIPIREGEAGRAKSLEPEAQWVIGIKEKLDQAKNDDAAGLWEKLSIYRIPQCLREIEDKAYIPQTVSLGPYHHSKRLLHSMERHKWRALHHALKRPNQRIEAYLEAVREVEERARACYEGPILMSSKEFVEMMVLDACFVLEIFRGATDGIGFTNPVLDYSPNDPVFTMRGTMHSNIQRDMIMLENQIPLFILDALYGLQMGSSDTGEVARLALRFFDPLIPTDAPLTKTDRSTLESPREKANANFDDSLTNQDGLHCLEVFRRSLLTMQKPKPEPRASDVVDKRRQQLIHCVTELKDSGIKFKKKKTDRLLDIEFKNGILKIPRLLIHDGTKSLFLNLIAFEQCHLGCTNDIASYVIFMDNLIDSTADVSYLHNCGIIENWLGSDAEVADLFNRLCQEVVFDINDSSFSRLSEEVNRYYERTWNTWRASLKHKYFNNPWSTISVFAAVILLGLTLAQTFYTVYAYYTPPS